MRIYLDSLLFHSALLDGLLLLLLAELFQLKIKTPRFIFALIAAVSYVFLELQRLPSALLMTARLFWPLSVVAIAYGIIPLQRLLWLFLGWHFAAATAAGAGQLLGHALVPLTAKLQGAALPAWLPPLVLLAGLRLGPLLQKLLRRRLSLAAKIYQVEIICALGYARVSALWDSGNLLRDGQSGMAVMILHKNCFSVLQALDTITPDILADYAREHNLELAVHALSYRTLGQNAASLSIIHPEHVYVRDDKGMSEVSCLLGLCDDPALSGEDFQAILPGSWLDSVDIKNGGEGYAESTGGKSLAGFL